MEVLLMPTVGRATEVNMNLFISIPDNIKMSIIKRQIKLSSYFTLQPLFELDHGGFPQQPEHVEVEKGGAGNK